MEIQAFPGSGYECNSYLIKDGIWIIVDVGTDQRADPLFRSLSEEKGLEKIKKIVLTHTHYDHAGGIRRMSELTGADVLVHPVEGEQISRGNYTATLASLFGEEMRSFDWSPIEEGSKISTGSTEFQILHLPGHSAGSIGLWEDKSRSLIVGDTVFADGGFGRYDLPTGDLDLLCSSIERISKMNVERLYPGHGRVIFERGAKHVAMSLNMIRRLVG